MRPRKLKLQTLRDDEDKEFALRRIRFAFNRAKSTGLDQEECDHLNEIVRIIEAHPSILWRGFGDFTGPKKVADAQT